MSNKAIRLNTPFEFEKPNTQTKGKDANEYYCIIVGFGADAQKRYMPKNRKGHSNG